MNIAHSSFLFKNKFPVTIYHIMLLGLLARLVVLWIYPDQQFPDATGYAIAGKKWLRSGTIETELHMPLYIIWTGLIGNALLLKLSDIIFSTASIWLIFQLTFSISQCRRTSLIAAFGAAVYPYFIFYAVSRLTETCYIFLLLCSFVSYYHKRFFLGALALVLSILVRPTLDLLAPVLIIAIAFFIHRLSWKNIIKWLGCYTIVYLTCMTPWWIHNYHKYNAFVRFNLASGYVLYSGNNPINQTGGGVNYGGGSQDLNFQDFIYISNFIERDKALKQAAINHIITHPKHFIYLIGKKFIRFWRLWPYTPHYNSWYYIIISLSSYGVVLLLSIVFAYKYFREYWRYFIPIGLLFAYLTAVHCVLISSIRYRLPLEPFLIIMAALTINRFLPASNKK